MKNITPSWKTFEFAHLDGNCCSPDCCEPLFNFREILPAQIACLYILRLQKESIVFLEHNTTVSNLLHKNAENLFRVLVHCGISFEEKDTMLLVSRDRIPWMRYIDTTWSLIETVEAK